MKSKSLKYRRLSSESEVMLEENSIDMMSIDDDDAFSPELISEDSCRICYNKRKKMFAHEEEGSNSKILNKLRKLKSNSALDVILSSKHLMESKQPNGRVEVNNYESKTPGHKSKDRTHISCIQVKHIMRITSESFRKKSHLGFRDCPSDSWAIQEDEVLCGAVNNYGAHWELASDLIYSIPGGGFYRGRYRDPLCCFKRYQELVCKHLVVDNLKGKATLKACEGDNYFNDQVHALLNVISELPNNELLLQKHFMVVLSSVWMSKYLSCHITDIYSSSVNKFPHSKNPRRLIKNKSMTTCRPSINLVRKALAEDHAERPGIVIPVSSPDLYYDHLGLKLEFVTEQTGDDTDFPSLVNVLIHEPEPQQAREPVERPSLANLSHRRAEDRFRVASAACFVGEESSHWASPSVLPTSCRHISGLTSLCKHMSASESGKPSKLEVHSNIDQQEESINVITLLHSPGQISTSVTEFHISPFLLDVGIDGSEFVLSDTLAEEDGHTEFLPYQFDSSFLADIEELDPISDLTDLG